jgi:hypothetical protein
MVSDVPKDTMVIDNLGTENKKPTFRPSRISIPKSSGSVLFEPIVEDKSERKAKRSESISYF